MSVEQEIVVSVESVSPEGKAYQSYRLWYIPGRGILSQKHTPDAEGVIPIDDIRVYAWVEERLRGDGLIGFRSITTWALVMVVLQVAVLIMLSFEDPGIEDENGIIRYISDNIAEHRGYGGVMLVAFAGSYLLLSMISLPHWLIGVSTLLIGGAAFGGAGVVLFHGDYKWQHIGSAAGFIFCGLLLHVVAIYTGPWRFRHAIRDFVLLLFTLGTAGVFGGVLIANSVYIDATQDRDVVESRFADRDPRLRDWWWVSGVCEYMLYINMCTLNIFVGERVFEHTAYSIFRALPVTVHSSTHTD